MRNRSAALYQALVAINGSGVSDIGPHAAIDKTIDFRDIISYYDALEYDISD